MAKHYYQFRNERGEFHATVNDETGKVIWSVDYPDFYEDDDTGELVEGSTIFDDGHMKGYEDVSGLKKHLVEMGFLDSDDELVYEEYNLGGQIGKIAKKSLKGSFALPVEMAVLVPSTRNVSEIINKRDFVNRIEDVQKYLSKIFGGYSAVPIDGGYLSDDKGLVTEDVERVVAFATEDAFKDNIHTLIYQIKQWCEDWGQEAMGYELEDDLFYVSGFTYDAKSIAAPEAKDDKDKNSVWESLSEAQRRSYIDKAKEQFSKSKFEDGGDLTEQEIEEMDSKEKEDEEDNLERVSDETDIPVEVLKEYADNFGIMYDDLTSNIPFAGRFDDEVSYAEDYKEQAGISNIEDYLEMYPTDMTILAGEEADNMVDSMSDDDLLEAADMLEDVERREEIADEISELVDKANEKREEYIDAMQELGSLETEEENEKADKRVKEIEDEIDEIEDEIESLKNEADNLISRSAAIDDAREQMRDKYYDEIYEKLNRDAVGYFVDELGYDANDLEGHGFFFDYEKLAKELEWDNTFIWHNGDLYVFSNYKRGGIMAKGGNVKGVENLVNEVNRLINLAVDSDGDKIPVYDTSSTWQSPTVYLPFTYSNGTLRYHYIDYTFGIGAKSEPTKGIVKKADMQFDGIPMLRDVAKQYRKALKQYGISYADGGWMRNGGETKSFEIYHETLSSALDEIEKWAKANGYDLSGDYFPDPKVGGINYGETKRFSRPMYKEGKKKEGLILVQIYRMDSGRYELNLYPSYEGGGETIKTNVPLFIRIEEYAREDAKSDVDLHKVAERAIQLGKNDKTLTMEDYQSIVGEMRKGGKTKAAKGIDLGASFEKFKGDLKKEKEIAGNKKFVYGITYQTVTPESAEQNDYEDTGWESEKQEEDLSEILKIANSYGIYEPSGSPIRGGEWWSSTSPTYNRNYFEKAEEVYYDLIVENLDGSELSKEETEFITEKLKSGRKLNWDEDDKEWWANGGETKSKYDILFYNIRLNRNKEPYTVQENRIQINDTYETALKMAQDELAKGLYEEKAYANILGAKRAKVKKDGEVSVFQEGGSLEQQNRQMIEARVIGIEHHAKELKQELKKNPMVDAWVVAKAETAYADLAAITHYLEAKNEMFEDNSIEVSLELPQEETDKMAGGGKTKMAKGGTATFDDKVSAISGNLKGKKVPVKYRKNYGKTYSKKESLEAAKRIAGAMRKKELAKSSKK